MSPRLAQTDAPAAAEPRLAPEHDSDVWPAFSDPGPWYDQGWHYTVPYVIYTTGVGYRRDHIDDARAADEGYDLLWNPQFTGKISYYDSYRDALGMAMIRNGDLDPNSGDPAVIDASPRCVE